MQDPDQFFFSQVGFEFGCCLFSKVRSGFRGFLLEIWIQIWDKFTWLNNPRLLTKSGSAAYRIRNSYFVLGLRGSGDPVCAERTDLAPGYRPL